MKITILFIILSTNLLLQTQNDISQDSIKSNNSEIKIQFPEKLDLNLKSDNDEFDINKYMPWIVALILGGLTVYVNIKIAKDLRKSNSKNLKEQLDANSENLKRQIEASKEITIKEFKATIASQNRQEWINEVRSTISEFLTYCLLATDPPPEQIEEITTKVLLMDSKLQLLLNHKKEEQKSLLNSAIALRLYVVEHLINKGEKADKFSEKHNEVVNKARAVFDIHWKKIKSLE